MEEMTTQLLSDIRTRARGTGAGAVRDCVVGSRHAGGDVPSGFTETLVASGLASPTAMQFAPDGRLFVAEQGGRLRVIKNGTLLSTPFLTVNGELRRASADSLALPSIRTSRRIDSSMSTTRPRPQPFTTASAGLPPMATSPSPAAKSCILDLDNLSSATNHNGGAHRVWSGRQALRGSRRERQRRQRPVVQQPARQDAAPECRRLDSDRQSVLCPRHRERTARFGPWVCAIRSPLHSTRRSRSSSSTTSARTRGRRSTTAPPAPTMAGQTQRAATTDPRFVRRSSTPTITPAARVPLPAAPSTRRRRRSSLPNYLNDYFFADYCAGWIRKLDPAAGNTVVTFATGISISGRSEGRQRRRPLLPRPRIRSIDRRRLSHLVRRERAEHHAAPGEPDRRARRIGHVQRARLGHRHRFAISGNATASTFPARRRQDYTFVAAASGDNGAQLPRTGVSNDSGSVISSKRDADGYHESAADRHDRPAGRPARSTAVAA